MTTFISMLRGINVSGRRTIRMAELKELYESLDFSHVTTYVQSGNVVFDRAGQGLERIAASIETGIARRFGFPVTVVLRPADDFHRILAGNPFIDRRNEDPGKLYVTFLSVLPAAPALDALKPPAGSADEFVVSGREIYLFCPGGYGRTKLSNSFFENKLKVPATTRNWRTVNALYALGNPEK
jgi:uncharacterized protein (DUF1697 family)